ncbi:DUF4349 domain-containing protein [Chitinophaga rhizophila]|uniref:DUF4349 domain-containing protein n=1 Tax=Chitinophaga rhizophila TaxID=2866212 RepID=A0ABS7GIY5_9BACT|nr:DUF4349 domain-containing protein [Chitinophaga rhizophila]MBW8687649.1 DUF4349 domain-containing protein [Chitinophaga rhizophila]
MARRCFVLSNNLIPVLVLLAGILLLSACGRRSASLPENTNVAAVQMEEMAAVDDAAAGSGSAKLSSFVATNDNPAEVPKKILKEGTIRYSVRDYNDARNELNQIVARFGGYIISENEQRSDISWETAIEIKVPAQRFDSCLNALSGTAQTLVTKSITAKDVTEEYIDVAARMKAKKEVEQRYLDILQQAKTVEDILSVEAQLKNIRVEVEAAQARLQYIDHNVAMSTIHLTFFQTFANTSPQGPGFFSRMLFSMKDGWNGVLSFVIDMAGMWPLLLVLVVGVLMIRRYRRRKRALIPRS